MKFKIFGYVIVILKNVEWSNQLKDYNNHREASKTLRDLLLKEVN